MGGGGHGRDRVSSGGVQFDYQAAVQGGRRTVHGSVEWNLEERKTQRGKAKSG
jgi:hypothetical protein